MYVCVCHAVTDHQIRSAVQQRQVTSLRDLVARTRLGTSCGRCARCAREVMSTCQAECQAAADAA